MYNINKISDKALKGENLNEDELLTLYEKLRLSELMLIADRRRQALHPENKVGWQIDRNINITNVCVAGCSFCNFSCKMNESERRYTTTFDQYESKIRELFELGGNQILLQGGLHPKYGLDFYSSLFRELKNRFPELKLHALGPPEIAHIARLERTSHREVLQKLIEAGLNSLPGAGAEILSDRVRRELSPGKPGVDEWIEVMSQAHRLNLPTSATMMFGHIESARERIKHLLILRDLQSECPKENYGFLSFIPWPVQSKGTRLALQHKLRPVYPDHYIRLVAISRIALTNIPNIQASWLTVGRDTAQVALYAGANDFGSIMIEENVVSSAGAEHSFDAEGIQSAIRQAGFIPWLRNQKYEEVLHLKSHAR
ncbi:MAG: radical SAM protein [Prevotellaceae bacterium]|jgi:cyclic dehypoxanthinyl futalosine synthase|nr:radical SAM protein [Prevotellaceae bacterium]